MKTSLTILITLWVLTTFGQDSNTRLYFKRTYFNENGKFHKSSIDTILVNQLLDIGFYKKHFNLPYYYPKPFINTTYKDTTIVIWLDTSGEKQLKTNSAYTIIYDSLSRVIKYTYSGCLNCGLFPFHVKLYYDKTNRPIRIEKRYGIGYTVVNQKLVKLDSKKLVENECKLKYDLQDNIIQMKCLNKGKLNMQIDRM